MGLFGTRSWVRRAGAPQVLLWQVLGRWHEEWGVRAHASGSLWHRLTAGALLKQVEDGNSTCWHVSNRPSATCAVIVKEGR